MNDTADEVAAGLRTTRLDALTQETLEVSQRWVNTPYYDAAEPVARRQWDQLILPFLGEDVDDMSHVLELAVGHGRMTQFLLEQADHVTGVDILQENIDFCADRFRNMPNLTLLKNDGVRLAGVEDATISHVFCFDSMIHFDSDVVRHYLAEFHRVMRPGATAFLHHSNLTRRPGGDFQRNAHARNFMSVELFSHYAQKEGLTVVRQKVIDWGQGEKRVANHDGLTLLRKD